MPSAGVVSSAFVIFVALLFLAVLIWYIISLAQARKAVSHYLGEE